jgi:hypothetical protein
MRLGAILCKSLYAAPAPALLPRQRCSRASAAPAPQYHPELLCVSHTVSALLPLQSL